MARTLE